MNNRFDEFSKSLADDNLSRRESIRRLGAAIGGALIAPLLVGAEIASANPDNRQRRRRAPRKLPFPRGGGGKDACTAFCKKCSTKKKQDQCLAACRGCSNDPKRLSGACGNYVCCGSGQSYCSGRCVDLKTDPGNCGSCGKTCGAGMQCINGACSQVACPAGQTRCGSTCVNLSSDNNNCGACGNACGTGTSCISGTCSGGGDCPFGTTRCNGICINTISDNANCGGCGIECAADEICTFGACLGTCSGC